MAELVPCIDCGHQISKSAYKCPKCTSDRPHGVHCLVCHPYELGAGLIGVPFPAKYAISRSDRYSEYYHPECAERVLTIPNYTICPECSIPIAQYWSWKELFNGHYWYARPCKNCGSPQILLNANVLAEIGIPEHDSYSTPRYELCCEKCKLPVCCFHRAFIDSTRSHHIFITCYHDFCVPKYILDRRKQESERRQREERIREQQREAANLNRRANNSSGCVLLFLLIGIGLLFRIFFS